MGTLNLRLPQFRLFLAGIFLLLVAQTGVAIDWLSFGPDGGDARAFASDPHDPQHLYLGTTSGWMYESHTGGGSWKRLARLGKRDDLVLDSILVDPSNPLHLVVGTWVLDRPDGGLYVSNDGGTTWSSQADMSGQSIRAMAWSASDSKTIVAGTLRGVFRSTDGGTRWSQISPPDSKELHEVESIAIDPKNPAIIYAGTWHLPWKTIDGGANWTNIKQGIIDDSDVFSILVDPMKPEVVYASACSGIYKSEDSGALFHKVQGIPSTARRTRVLMQDPSHLDTVFAGTTEGLFRSSDAGKSWMRTTGPDVIINDVYVDATNSSKVMLATDRRGVLTSVDGGFTFQSSNQGFSSRQITAFAQDRNRPATVYVGMVNDKEWGGVFQSRNGGLNWEQMSSGLDGKDVFALGQAPDGTLLAGTSKGIYRQTDQGWKSAQAAVVVPQRRVAVKGRAAGRGHSTVAERKPVRAAVANRGLEGSIYSLTTTGNTELAATTDGILTSADSGMTWSVLGSVPESMGGQQFTKLASSQGWVVAAGLHVAMRSKDSGMTWESVKLPEGFTQVSSLAVEDNGDVWVAGREGVFVSSDSGASWSTPKNLFVSGASSIFYDEKGQRMLVNSGGSLMFVVHLPSRTVTFEQTGWSLRFVRPAGDHFIAATLWDGMVVQPRMVDSGGAH